MSSLCYCRCFLSLFITGALFPSVALVPMCFVLGFFLLRSFIQTSDLLERDSDSNSSFSVNKGKITFHQSLRG